jgi:hypothetical protein
MNNNMKLIDAIMNGDAIAAREAFTAAITDKVNTVLDIRRVTMASDVFNQVQEGTTKEMLNPNYVKDLPEQDAEDILRTLPEEEELDEAVKLRSKVIITKGPKDVQGKTGFVGEINTGRYKGDESYVIDVQGGGHITLRRGSFKLAESFDSMENDLDEAVRISSERYVRSHSKQPSGRGGWIFSSSSKGERSAPDFTFNGTYADAKQKAREWAKTKGFDYIYVMEGTEDDLDEAQTPQQKFDFQKFLHGAMSQDEYNKKYKLGKYRPAGNKLAGPGGIYKNLVKQP